VIVAGDFPAAEKFKTTDPGPGGGAAVQLYRFEAKYWLSFAGGTGPRT